MNSYTCYYVIHACVFDLDTITCQKKKKKKIWTLFMISENHDTFNACKSLIEYF